MIVLESVLVQGVPVYFRQVFKGILEYALLTPPGGMEWYVPDEHISSVRSMMVGQIYYINITPRIQSYFIYRASEGVYYNLTSGDFRRAGYPIP